MEVKKSVRRRNIHTSAHFCDKEGSVWVMLGLNYAGGLRTSNQTQIFSWFVLENVFDSPLWNLSDWGWKKGKCRMREKERISIKNSLPFAAVQWQVSWKPRAFPICRCHCPMVFMFRSRGAMTARSPQSQTVTDLCRYRSPLLLGV